MSLTSGLPLNATPTMATLGISSHSTPPGRIGTLTSSFGSSPADDPDPPEVQDPPSGRTLTAGAPRRRPAHAVRTNQNIRGNPKSHLELADHVDREGATPIENFGNA